MEIMTSVEGTKATITLVGKLTVSTSSELSAAIDVLSDDVCDIDIDLAGVDYVASAGLRVVVAADKLTQVRGGTLRLLNPSEGVMEVLDMTGLVDVLDVVG